MSDKWPTLNELRAANLNNRVRREFDPKLDRIADDFSWYLRPLAKATLWIQRRKRRKEPR